MHGALNTRFFVLEDFLYTVMKDLLKLMESIFSGDDFGNIKENVREKFIMAI